MKVRIVQNPFSLSSLKTNKFSLGVSKYFSTGTLLTGELSTTDAESVLANGSITDNTTGEMKFSIAQNLWKDAFGSATRKQLKAGDLATASRMQGYRDEVQNWGFDLVKIYYNAWLAQAQARATIENVNRRERLLKITKKKNSKRNGRTSRIFFKWNLQN